MNKGKTSAEKRNRGQMIKLTVNDKAHILTFGEDVEPWESSSYDVYPWDTLAYTLREKLGLTGTKVACDTGACGSCTVLLDKRPVLSCTMLTADCDGKEILTIEGLGDPERGTLDPVQKAFISHHGIQCGFCIPGMIMSAKALLEDNPNPTEEEVKEGLSGNLCRCGNYGLIIESVMEAAKLIRSVD
jgi:carbon-monoxide dehydrogenase small subunit